MYERKLPAHGRVRHQVAASPDACPPIACPPINPAVTELSALSWLVMMTVVPSGRMRISPFAPSGLDGPPGFSPEVVPLVPTVTASPPITVVFAVVLF